MGGLQSLSAFPEKVVLRGAGYQQQQLIITGPYANGGVRDLTRQAKYRGVGPIIVAIQANGLLTAVQNGFRLSLLGFELEVDYIALTREARGRRRFLAAPQLSLLLRKRTGEMPHGGGKRLQADSQEYKKLLRWIRAGAPFGNSTDPKIIG